eukprot:scaffold7900_cov169-Isochrysis_galbana.AAC.1
MKIGHRKPRASLMVHPNEGSAATHFNDARSGCHAPRPSQPPWVGASTSPGRTCGQGGTDTRHRRRHGVW